MHGILAAVVLLVLLLTRLLICNSQLSQLELWQVVWLTLVEKIYQRLQILFHSFCTANKVH